MHIVLYYCQDNWAEHKNVQYIDYSVKDLILVTTGNQTFIYSISNVIKTVVTKDES